MSQIPDVPDKHSSLLKEADSIQQFRKVIYDIVGLNAFFFLQLPLI